MTSETPRTEAAETRANASTNPYSVLREHARDLERKLAEAMDRSQEDWVALTQRAERAEAKLAALQAKPDVAGLVDAYDAARYRFEEWDGDVLIPEQNADLEWRVTEKNAARQRIIDALQAKPDVAGLVESLQTLHAAKTSFPRGAGGQQLGLETYRLVATGETFEALMEAADALLSLSAQLAEKEAECEGLRQDAERFQYLQNIPVVVAQQFFWNYSSRKERAKAIDSARKP